MSIKKHAPETATALKKVDHFSRRELESKSVAQLIQLYNAIESNVMEARYQQCKIVREIRMKHASDVQFGHYIATTSLSEIHTMQLTRMIRIADFFETKSLEGIFWSSALLLSEPKHAPIADKIYTAIAGKHVRPIDVRRMIDENLDKKSQKPENKIYEGEFEEIPKPPGKPVQAPTPELVATATPLIVTLQPPKPPQMIPVSVDEDGIEDYREEDIHLKLDSLDALKAAMSRLLEPFDSKDRLSVLRELIRQEEQRTAPKLSPKPVTTRYKL